MNCESRKAGCGITDLSPRGEEGATEETAFYMTLAPSAGGKDYSSTHCMNLIFMASKTTRNHIVLVGSPACLGNFVQHGNMLTPMIIVMIFLVYSGSWSSGKQGFMAKNTIKNIVHQGQALV